MSQILSGCFWARSKEIITWCLFLRRLKKTAYMIEFPFDVCFCTSRIPTMFVSVRKMISIFESKKQPRPLSLPPCVSNDQTQRENPILLDGSSAGSKPHPSSLSPAPSTVICRPRLHAGETNVTGGARRVRDSWPIGKLDYYPRAGCLALSVETKEPISSKRFPHTSSRNKPTSSSKPTISSTDTAPPTGHSQTQRSENNPRSVRIGSSCKSSVSDQKCQNPKWDSLTVREERGGAITHKHRLRPSDSTLLSLLLFLHRLVRVMQYVKIHFGLCVFELNCINLGFSFILSDSCDVLLCMENVALLCVSIKLAVLRTKWSGASFSPAGPENWWQKPTDTYKWGTWAVSRNCQKTD